MTTDTNDGGYRWYTNTGGNHAPARVAVWVFGPIREFCSKGQNSPDTGLIPEKDLVPITHAEARAILGDKWPANWPQGEGAVESTTAPATGQAVAGAIRNASSPDAAKAGRQGDEMDELLNELALTERSLRECAEGRFPEGCTWWTVDANRVSDAAATIRELQERTRVLENERDNWRFIPDSLGGHMLCVSTGVKWYPATAALTRARSEGV